MELLIILICLLNLMFPFKSLQIMKLHVSSLQALNSFALTTQYVYITLNCHGGWFNTVFNLRRRFFSNIQLTVGQTLMFGKIKKLSKSLKMSVRRTVTFLYHQHCIKNFSDVEPSLLFQSKPYDDLAWIKQGPYFSNFLHLYSQVK